MGRVCGVASRTYRGCDGRNESQIRIRVRRLPSDPSVRDHRLPLPGGGVAAQGGRAGGTRPLAAARQDSSLTVCSSSSSAAYCGEREHDASGHGRGVDCRQLTSVRVMFSVPQRVPSPLVGTHTQVGGRSVSHVSRAARDKSSARLPLLLADVLDRRVTERGEPDTPDDNSRFVVVSGEAVSGRTGWCRVPSPLPWGADGLPLVRPPDVPFGLTSAFGRRTSRFAGVSFRARSCELRDG